MNFSTIVDGGTFIMIFQRYDNATTHKEEEDALLRGILFDHTLSFVKTGNSQYLK